MILLDRPVVVEGLMQSVAPSWRAISNLAGLMSTAMMRLALRHDRADDRRQADAAEAEHGDAGAASTLAVLSTAPMPVVTPQPSRQTLSSGASLRIFASEISGSTVYSEKVEVPM